MNILILVKIVIRKKMGQIFCLHQIICHCIKTRTSTKTYWCWPIISFLSWLRLGSPLKHTAWLFNLSKGTTSRYIVTWANFIYLDLGCVPIWLTKDIVVELMPECSKNSYPNTRVIVDYTELFCRNPLV